MRLPSNLKPGISIGREPVAMTMLSAWIVTLSPSASVSSTVLREVSRADAGAVVAAVALEQRAHAAGQLADDVALPGLQLRHVDADVVGEDADVGGVAELVEHLRRR